MRHTSLSLFALTIVLAACTPAPTGPNTLPDGGATSSFVNAVMLTYSDMQAGYAIQYPYEWAVQMEASLPPLNRESKGTAFIPPASMTQGTSWTDGMVFVEKTTGACPAYSPSDRQSINGSEFTHGTSSDVGAGNKYLMDMYSTSRKVAVGPAIDGIACYTITAYRHLCNLGPDCGKEHAQPFDDEALQARFREMVGTFHTL